MDWGFLAFLADGRFVAAWALAGVGAAALAGLRAPAGQRGPAAAGALAFPPLALIRAPPPGISLAAPAYLAATALARAASLGFAVESWLAFLAVAAALLLGRRAEGLGPSLAGDGLVPAAAATAAAGTVTGVVSPLVVGAGPPPDTFAFWGFAAAGLAVALPAAALASLPFGRGSSALRAAPAAAGAALLALALVFAPVAAHEARLREPIALAPDVVEELEESPEPLHRLEGGALATAAVATRALREGHRTRSATALEAARRAAAVIEAAGGRTGAVAALDRARRDLQNGRAEAALAALGTALAALVGHAEHHPRVPANLSAYRGAPVVDAQGLPIGRVAVVDGRCLGLDLDRRAGTPARLVPWSVDAVVLGDGGRRGPPLVAVPEFGPEAGTGPASGCGPGV